LNPRNVAPDNLLYSLPAMRDESPSSTGDRTCPKCGARLFRDQGRCDACLLALAAVGADEEDVPSAREGGDLGDYELLEVIGRGGQGRVYRARQRSLNRIVALKLIPLGQWNSPARLKRFQLEAEAAARLDHPGIVPIYEIGEGDGHCFFSMRLVAGGRLDEVFPRRPAPVRQAAGLVARLARTVHFAHQRGILHRDIKPGNILLDADGQPQLTDFGLAKLVEQDSTVTHSLEVLGTPSFMAPEQATGQHQQVATTTDVYGLGAVLYFLLTGTPPFAGGTTYETIRLVIETEPRPPAALNGRVDRDLETICLKCLEKEPAKRYGSAEALAEELDRYLRGELILARQVTPGEKLWRWCRRKPALAASLACSLLLLIGLAVGASVAALRIQKESNRRLAAEHDARDKLWNSYLVQARANRASVQAGHAFDGLEAIRAAAAMRPAAELRDEAIALLAQPDLRLVEAPPRSRKSTSHIVLDATFDRYALTDTTNVVALRRRHDDHLLAQLHHPDVARISGHGFSPDGGWLTTGGQEANSHLWELADSGPRRRASIGSVWGLAFRPDSLAVAAVTWSGDVEVRDLPDGRLIIRFASGLPLPKVQFSPGGGLLCAYSEQTNRVHLFALPDAARARTFVHPAPVKDIAWHPGGEWLACTSGEGVYIWSLRRDEPPKILAGHDVAVWSVAVHPGGELLASSGADGTTRLWESSTGREMSRLAVPGSRLRFSRDGGLLPLHWTDEPRLWLCEIRTGDVAQRWRVPGEHQRTVLKPRAASFSPDGDRLLIPTAQGAVIWDVGRGVAIGQIAEPGIANGIWEPGGAKLITAGADGVKRWTAPLVNELPADPLQAALPAARLVEVLEPSPECGPVAISTGGHIAFAQGDVVRLAGSDRAFPLAGVWSVAISPSGERLAGFALRDGRLRVWDTASGATLLERTLQGSAQLAFSTDNRRLAVCTGDELLFLDLADGSEPQRIARDAAKLGGPVVFSPDGQLVAFAITRTRVRLLDARTLDERANFDSPDAKLISWLAFDPSGQRLAVGTETQLVQLWDLPRLHRELVALGLDWNLPAR